MLPAGLRTLDALHLAVALDLGPRLLGLITYDDRQAQAAREHAIRVVCPT
jgi:predicted nucleic acid-binding protein